MKNQLQRRVADSLNLNINATDAEIIGTIHARGSKISDYKN